MTQYNEGQEVEIARIDRGSLARATWRKAKIVANLFGRTSDFWVEFPDGTRAVFAAEHIRTVLPPTEAESDPDGVNQAIRHQLANQK